MGQCEDKSSYVYYLAFICSQWNELEKVEFEFF